MNTALLHIASCTKEWIFHVANNAPHQPIHRAGALLSVRFLKQTALTNVKFLNEHVHTSGHVCMLGLILR